MTETAIGPPKSAATALPILATISLCHLLNDMMQSLLPAIYPVLKSGFDLSFAQIGLLTLVYSMTASLLQPLVGLYTDGRPMPYSLAVGMGASLVGLVAVAFASSYPALLAGGMTLGIGSAIFHPEASRVARLSSGGAHGLAQSLFQVGGNFGSALGPLLAAFFILPHGQSSLAWFAVVALGGMAALTVVGNWCKTQGHARRPAGPAAARHPELSRRQVGRAMTVLLVLVFSKYVYLAGITSFYTFYLMQRFGASTHTAEICLFVFLAAGAAGTIIGGPIGDRIGRRPIIWVSILGVVPFTLALPYVGLEATIAVSAIIGLVLASAFPAIVVYAQELVPGRVGLVSGLFFGLAFGAGGVGAAALGVLADRTSIAFVYEVCSFLPLIGLLAVLLPNVEGRRSKPARRPL